MTYNYNKLRGRIVEKFGSLNRFSKSMNLSLTSLSLKINNKVPFTQPEIDRIKDLLEIPNGEVASYFFTHAVQ